MRGSRGAHSYPRYSFWPSLGQAQIRGDCDENDGILFPHAGQQPRAAAVVTLAPPPRHAHDLAASQHRHASLCVVFGICRSACHSQSTTHAVSLHLFSASGNASACRGVRPDMLLQSSCPDRVAHVLGYHEARCIDLQNASHSCGLTPPLSVCRRDMVNRDPNLPVESVLPRAASWSP